MKTTSIAISAILFTLITSVSASHRSFASETRVAPQDTVRYKDGMYEGKSRASYTDEPFWGIIKVKIENGLFTGISFMVRDSNLHETFDGNYEKHFTGNQLYIEQSRNDWKGVQNYPKKLLESQDIRKVDAVTGATWSYNIFRASLEEALKSANK